MLMVFLVSWALLYWYHWCYGDGNVGIVAIIVMVMLVSWVLW